jgi:hypothetical protein
MSEMVERVAEAIAKKRDCYGLAECERDPCNCLRFARTAIEAMREPTEELRRSLFGAGMSMASYQFVIDAALKEPDRPD